MRIYALFAILLPIVCMALSGSVVYLIPGCTVDEGAGASAACGAMGPFLSSGILGGFVWCMLGLFGLVPAAIISVIADKMSVDHSTSKKSNESKSENDPEKWWFNF